MVKKGYGFMQPDDGGKDLFVRVSTLVCAGIGNLNQGQQVKSRPSTAAKARRGTYY